MSPRVLVDVTAVPVDRGGVGRYVDELLPALARAGGRLVVACQVRDVDRYRRLPGDVDVVAAPAAVRSRPLRLTWEQTGLPALLRSIQPDVVHCPHYTSPFATPTPVVVTVHDATFFTHPQVHSRGKGAFFRAATRIAVRRASRCLVPSQATREELCRVVGAAGDCVDVAYHGVDRSTFSPPSPAEVERVSTALGLGGAPYVAFLGTLEPRKNVPALIRAWTEACRHLEGRPVLVLAGARGWDSELEAAVRAVPASLRVVRPGYLPLGDLRGFLGGATVVAYPSLGEGFGLPVLEAMACGAAVLTTRRLALPEVGGDAVAYSEPDAHSLATALADLLAEPDRRAALSAKALSRAAQFTWDRCAQQHLRTYEAAARGGSAPPATSR